MQDLIELINSALPQYQCGRCDTPGCRPYAKEIAEGIIENRLRELYDSNQSLTQDIIQKEEFQKNLIDNLVDALIVFDFDMNILKINKEALKLLGFDKKKCSKKH